MFVGKQTGREWQQQQQTPISRRFLRGRKWNWSKCWLEMEEWDITQQPSLSLHVSQLALSLARSHVLDFFYRRKLNERKKKVFPPPLLHFCSILPTFWLPKLADGAKSYRNKPGTLFFPVRQKTPVCAFITFCSLQASYKHTILCTAEDTSHISSVCQADLYKAERSQTFDSSLDRMMSPKMSHWGCNTGAGGS